MAILTSHKQAITYLEHVKISKIDERVCFSSETKGKEQFFSLPYGNVSVLLLGPGASITQAAIHHLCAEGVLIGFSGGDGFPIFCGSLSEYRPTKYCQMWVLKWNDYSWRIETAKQFQLKRIALVNEFWKNHHNLSSSCLDKVEQAGAIFKTQLDTAYKKETVLGFEAVYAKTLYQSLAKEYSVAFTREPRKKTTPINELIDAHNYYAYGVSGVVLWTLGIPHCFPVLHGDTRRGALVFDLADIIKDALLLPLAFKSGIAKKTIPEHKKECASVLQLSKSMPILFEEMKKALALSDFIEDTP